MPKSEIRRRVESPFLRMGSSVLLMVFSLMNLAVPAQGQDSEEITAENMVRYMGRPELRIIREEGGRLREILHFRKDETTFWELSFLDGRLERTGEISAVGLRSGSESSLTPAQEARATRLVALRPGTPVWNLPPGLAPDKQIREAEIHKKLPNWSGGDGWFYSDGDVRTVLQVREGKIVRIDQAFASVEKPSVQITDLTQRDTAEQKTAEELARQREERRKKWMAAAGVFLQVLAATAEAYADHVNSQPPPKVIATGSNVIVATPSQTSVVVQQKSQIKVKDGARECRRDSECRRNEVCVKPAGDFRMKGICGVPVDEFGAPTLKPIDPVIGPREVTPCSFNLDCSIGFQCIKKSGQLYGVCGRTR
jgi:hypothetical protein